ncbi:MAG: hypothetical protein AABY22_27810 [Nanoarchaeota archaeon]
MKYKIFLLLSLISFVLFLNLVSASVTCSPPSVTANYNFGSSFTNSTFCSNNGNFSVTLSASGSYIGINPITISPGSFDTINVTFSSTAPIGTHLGNILFSDNSTPVPISFNVFSTQQNQTQNPSPILIFPTSKIITVKQGDEKTQNILITVPSSYPRTITIQSVDFNPNVETIKFGDLNLGQVAPGQSIQIPILFSGVNAQTGTYLTQLSVFAIDSQGQVILPSVNLQLQVSAGISPTVNFSLSELPTCSLNAVEFNMNSTYSMTCSRPNPNIEIHTIIDNFYLKGVSVDQTSSQYIYTVQAKKIGNTKIKAEFLYQGSSIGEVYEQEIRITTSGNSPIPGTVLDFIFYQGGSTIGIKSLSAKETIIQVVDNQTKSLVQSSSLYLGGASINNTITLESGKNYELRASAPGYLDLTSKFNVTSVPSVITLLPNQQSYILGQTVNITTDSNATLYIDGVQTTSPYLFTTPGIRVLKASKEGYVDTFMNITVNSLTNVNTISPEFNNWGKGDDVTMKLSSSGIWNVTFEKLTDGFYGIPSIISTGVGDEVKFKLDDYGRYTIYLDNNFVSNYVFEKKGIGKWIGDNWLWGILGVVVIFIGYFLFKGKGSEASGEKVLSYE